MRNKYFSTFVELRTVHDTVEVFQRF
jgi:hypothetical protein